MPDLSEIINEIKNRFICFEFIEGVDVYPEMKIYINTKAGWCPSEKLATERKKAIDLRIEGIKKSYPNIYFIFMER